MKMQSELDKIVRGFRANVMSEILHHRTISGAGAVPSFVANVSHHRQRVQQKLDNMRAANLPATTIKEIAKAESIVNDLAQSETERAINAGAVEFAASEVL
jgi:hypothetical protein